MRNLAFFCCMLLIKSSLTWGQAPQRINYQAIARNASGIALVSQSVAIKVEILDSSQSGILYAETHSVTTNAFGLFTLSIGGGTVLQGYFQSIPWGRGSTFIRTYADLTGGSNYQLMGTSQLLSVPYAFFANKADTSLQVDELTRKAIKRHMTYHYLKL